MARTMLAPGSMFIAESRGVRFQGPRLGGFIASTALVASLATAGCTRDRTPRYPNGDTVQEATLYNEIQISTAMAGMEGAIETLAALEQAQVRISKVVAQALCVSAVLWIESHHACPTPSDILEHHFVSPDVVPQDAWDNPYRITCGGENADDPTVTSAGPDGVFGTADDISAAGK
jgi:hypothetical protein